MEQEYLNLTGDQIAFPKLGILFDADPTAFTIFGVSIQWYGLLITIGMLLAIAYCFPKMRKYGIDPDRSIDAVIGGIIGGIVGARLYYVILEWDRYKDNLSQIFNLRSGGLAIYGGIIGAVLVGGLIAKLRKVKLLPLLDLVGQGFLIGQCLGRWGNFFNQEAFGCNTDSVFGMTGSRIQSYISSSYIYTNSYQHTGVEMTPDLPVHPCFLYESLWCLAGFILLAVISKKFRKFDGQIFLMYVAWYGLGRSFIEGLRTDSLVIGSLRVSQVLAILCFVAAVIILIAVSLKVKRMGSDYVLYCNTEESKELLRQSAERKSRQKNSKKSDAAEKTEASDEIKETAGDDTSEASADSDSNNEEE